MKTVNALPDLANDASEEALHSEISNLLQKADLSRHRAATADHNS